MLVEVGVAHTHILALGPGRGQPWRLAALGGQGHVYAGYAPLGFGLGLEVQVGAGRHLAAVARPHFGELHHRLFHLGCVVIVVTRGQAKH